MGNYNAGAGVTGSDRALIDYWSGQPDTVEAQFLYAKNNSLNRFPPILYCALYGPGTSLAGMATNQALVEGGGTRNLAGAAWMAIGASIFQTQKTTAWGLTIFAKMPTPVTGKNTQVGIRNGGATHSAGFAVAYDTNAAAQTKFVAFIEGVTADTGIVADGNFHRMTMVVVGANLAFFIDGAAAGTIALSNFTADEPMFPGGAGTDASACRMQYLKYGFIAPT